MLYREPGIAAYRLPFASPVGLRIEYAKQQMVEHPDLTIAVISEESGFLSLSYFSRIFTEKEGCSPSKWRKSFVEEQ